MFRWYREAAKSYVYLIVTQLCWAAGKPQSYNGNRTYTAAQKTDTTSLLKRTSALISGIIARWEGYNWLMLFLARPSRSDLGGSAVVERIEGKLAMYSM